jgi:hypothetical protein
MDVTEQKSANALSPESSTSSGSIQKRKMSRIKAALIHLAISATIACIVLYLMFFWWYPSPYFKAMGGDTLILLLVGVDVILGPLITLVIFNTEKKSLKFDLTCIAIIQFAALSYGTSVMFQARPIYSVYFKDRFDIVTPSRIPPEELERANGTPYSSHPLTGPRLVAVQVPASAEENNRMMFHPKAAADFVAFPQHYVPYEQKAIDAGKVAKPLAQLKERNPQIAHELDALLKTNGVIEANAGFLPVRTFSDDMAAVVEKSTGKLLGMIYANPW